MAQLIKVPNKSLSFRLKNFNYNTVYSQLRMLLEKEAALFADIKSTAIVTSWSTEDSRRFVPMSQAPATEIDSLRNALSNKISGIRKKIEQSGELAPLADELLEVPNDEFVFYTADDTGNPDFVIAGWGCREAYTSPTQTGYIKAASKTVAAPKKPAVKPEPPVKPAGEGGGTVPPINPPEPPAPPTPPVPPINPPEPPVPPINPPEPPLPPVVPPQERKRQHVTIKVINQNGVGVDDCSIELRSGNETYSAVTNEEGVASVCDLPYYADFTVSFPNMPEVEPRRFQVEPKREVYEAHIRYLLKYSPVLFVEDQNGNVMYDSEVKVVVNGKEETFSTGVSGVVQLPTMTEGQSFMVIDPANFSTRQEYSVTPENAKQPYHFTIRRRDARQVGIHVIDKESKPIEGVEVEIDVDGARSVEKTDAEGRASFPRSAFRPGKVGLNLILPNHKELNSTFDYTPDESDYTIRIEVSEKEIVPPGGDKKKTGRKWNRNWLWLLLLLPLIGAGLWWWLNREKIPTMAEMEKGVVLIHSQVYYTVDFTALTEDSQQFGTFYFNYDPNTNRLLDNSFDKSQFTPGDGWGTGFLISEDGLIATNRHVADPIPPEHMASAVKAFFRNEKNVYRHKADSIGDILRKYSAFSVTDPAIAPAIAKLQAEEAYYKQGQQMMEAFLETGDFKVNSHCYSSVAFVGQLINSYDDFTGTVLKATGQPGGLMENDLAIIQLKKKDKDVPDGAFIFKVPEEEPLGNNDGQLPEKAEDRKVTIIGYNEGPALADLQNGIHPQPIPGTIIQNSDKYHIGYDANTLGGSSGSPVIDEQGRLVAINNAGLKDGAAKGFGVRTNWLYELMKSLKTNNK